MMIYNVFQMVFGNMLRKIRKKLKKLEFYFQHLRFQYLSSDHFFDWKCQLANTSRNNLWRDAEKRTSK